MSTDSERDRQLLEKLERMLAGQDEQGGAPMNADSRADLDFARKMAALRAEPTPRFKANLKARLIEKLHEQEVRERGGVWLWRLARQPVWQAISVLVVMAMVGGVLWRAGVFQGAQTGDTQIASTEATTPTTKAVPPSTAPATAPTTPKAGAPSPAPAPAPAPAAVPGVTASAATDKGSYGSGDRVKIEVVLQNTGNVPVTFVKFPPILSIMDSGSRLAVQTFPAGADQRTLKPGQSTTFPAVWSSAQPGTYYLELEDVDYQGKALRMNFQKPVSINVLPAAIEGEGGIIKTLEPR